MPMYNLRKYSDNYSKTSGSLWHYYRDKPFLNNDATADFPTTNNSSASFNLKTKIANRANNSRKDDKTTVPLKYLRNIWRTLQMPLINCEINLILTWSGRCFIIYNAIDSQVPTLTTTNTKLYQFKIRQNCLNN